MRFELCIELINEIVFVYRNIRNFHIMSAIQLCRIYRGFNHNLILWCNKFIIQGYLPLK